VPRKNVPLDMAIHRLIKEINITIPIAHIKGTLYLIGCSRCNLDLKREFLLVRIGGGFHKL
jgi:hypothetical protein